MRIYRTSDGIGRGSGDELEILDLPPDDDYSYLQVGFDRAANADVVKRVPLHEAELLAPVSSSSRIFLVGGNYATHLAETGTPTPQTPAILPLPVGAVTFTPPLADIVLPTDAPSRVDYEGELAVIVGRNGHHIPAGDGWRYVAGYSIANDVSARDVQFAGIKDGKVVDPGSIVRSKSFPTFKPLGPNITTTDEMADLSALRLQTRVNGELHQDSALSDMIFGVSELVEELSSTLELMVGDVILTGTPGGVGFVDDRYLQPGDTVEISVDRVGSIRNDVVSA